MKTILFIFSLISTFLCFPCFGQQGGGTDVAPWVEQYYTEELYHTTATFTCGTTTDRYLISYSTYSGGTGSDTIFEDTCFSSRYGYTWKWFNTNWTTAVSGDYTISQSDGQNGSSGTVSTGATFANVYCSVTDTIYPDPDTTDTWDRTAHTYIYLHTGGKSGSNKSQIFTLSGSANRITDPRYRYPDQSSTTSWFGITPTSISMDGVTLNSSGNAYVSLADNSTYGITPTANYDHYDYDCTVQKHKIVIKQNTTDVTDGSTADLVGQQINFSAELSPPGPPISAYLWSIPGQIVHNYGAPDNGTVDWNVPLTTSSTTLYWLDGGDGRTVTCTIAVPGASAMGTTTKNIKRPTYTTTVDSVGAVNIGPVYLQLGDNGTSPGVLFSKTVTMPNGFVGGQFAWSQTVDVWRRRQTDTGVWSKWRGTGLDTGFPYTTLSFFDDSPGTVLANPPGAVRIEAKDISYDTYLMFKPDGDSIWVSLAKASWTWAGTVTRPNTSSSWSLSGVTPSTPSFSDCTDLPTWTTVITSAMPWQPE